MKYLILLTLLPLASAANHCSEAIQIIRSGIERTALGTDAFFPDSLTLIGLKHLANGEQVGIYRSVYLFTEWRLRVIAIDDSLYELHLSCVQQ